MAEVDKTEWEPLIEMAIDMLTSCPLCGGGENRFDLDGQTWLGMGYSAPQYVHLRHFCDRPKEDNFIQGLITIRARDLDQAVAIWNRFAPTAPIGSVR